MIEGKRDFSGALEIGRLPGDPITDDHPWPSPGRGRRVFATPYNRWYTQNETHEILCASERRPRPTGSPHLGHPITGHGDGRSNIFDKR
jgi:hypothetical protein